MSDETPKSTILVIRPRPRVGTGQTDVLLMDIESCEELVHRQACPNTAPWFKALTPRIRDILASGITMVLLDLREVTYVNSTSLGNMVDLQQVIETNGGKLVLVNPNPRVSAIFEVTQLDKVFTVFDSLERGAKYLRTGHEPQI
jgi:anti-sigma B factor antagonist